ncbi:peroxiredoxin [Mycobacterium botniense]|uniref:Peroxiredoxin n=1 Tax=Mycobacterium botniense TaxID=84962 RepID=A0A7I9XV34_9MYCO|nr:peroxiredoxin [Mycobacterium botniense]GFG73257.1 peroxiredoxin [Mycobacterium botniense]
MTTTAEGSGATTTMPRIGDPAPEFTAVTTQGKIHFPADYKGKWVIFFSHPGDFTPVCTSEFVTFASMQQQLAAYNTELLGLSVDGIASHLAWLQQIKDKITFRDHKNVDVTFPVIDDASQQVARKYGMIMPGEDSTKAVRAVFFIDPKGVIRAIIYYPLILGRNSAELLRVIKALQTTDHFGVATPADWQPGDPVILPIPENMTGMKERQETLAEGMTCQDWYFCTKEIPAEEVESAIRAK